MNFFLDYGTVGGSYNFNRKLELAFESILVKCHSHCLVLNTNIKRKRITILYMHYMCRQLLLTTYAFVLLQVIIRPGQRVTG